MFDVGNLLVDKGTVKDDIGAADVNEALFGMGDLRYFFRGVSKQKLQSETEFQAVHF